ncbi:nanM [Symbiodinium natans]|uniref:NanM protein n=1 Tax=Symbiodinium natans TaxID=878477 RepID=A0A812ICW1_9DINO|nr:nanM [Symbiodinium natans]
MVSGVETMIIYGGRGPSGISADVFLLDVAGLTWMQGTSSPQIQARHSAVWTGTGMLAHGGGDGNVYLDILLFYDPVGDTWATLTPATSNVPTLRLGHEAVWTGTEMIVQGGVGTDGAGGLGGDGRTWYVHSLTGSTATWTPFTLTPTPPKNTGDLKAIWAPLENTMYRFWGDSKSGDLRTYLRP